LNNDLATFGGLGIDIFETPSPMESKTTGVGWLQVNFTRNTLATIGPRAVKDLLVEL
jgi:hypothetical protein